ncbi:glutaredoxin-C11-like [Chenopodium quinoa]|uniref:Glutaredoxin domain-containing protein n=1 Tax=Chenopodium quinoa TaxID=63459 RepID=A0A803MUA7_CHEQI|nr:glutaredoxin-C11-like [Chenopodium quinoa]
MERVNALAKTKAAMIFSKSTDCMSHSIETLFHELGASPGVHELDHDPKGREMEWALQKLGCNPTVPAVFIGGKYVGSAGDVLAAHLNGSLKDRLMQAKAIWL